MKSYMKPLIIFDNILNYLLGIVFAFFPLTFQSWISPNEILPKWLWILFGIGFLLFAGWQTYNLKKGFSKRDRVFASVMALIPVVALTIALLLPLKLYLVARILLWLGDLYMFVLGILYLH